MPHADVVYLVEHLSRELDIACAVKSLARQRHGLEIDVRSIVYDLDAPYAGPLPRVVVVPFFGSRRSYGVRKVMTRLHGAAAINLQFEQLVSPGNAAIKGPRDTVARTQVLQGAMGEFYADFLATRGVLAENVTRIGSLACQLYRAPYRKFYEGRRAELAAQHGLDPQRRWIFFPENFGAAFFSGHQIRQRLRNGYDAGNLEEYCRHSRNAFREIATWCAAAARQDGAEIVVRPRPATARETFVAAFREAAGALPERRLHFLKEHSVREWILASDAVVSSFSTTLLESAVAGQPSYLLAPEPLPASMHSAWHEAAVRIDDREGFLKLASGARLEPPTQLARWADRHLLAYGDAIGNVVDVLADIVSGRRAAPALRLTPMQQQTERLYYAYKGASRKVKALFRRRRDKYHEKDHFRPEDVAARTAQWDAIFQAPPARKKSA